MKISIKDLSGDLLVIEGWHEKVILTAATKGPRAGAATIAFNLDHARTVVVALSNAIAHEEANKTRRLSRESQCPAI